MTEINSIFIKYSYIILMIFLFAITPSLTYGNDNLEFLGTYDNVKSTTSGHCYGSSVSIWKINKDSIIGLFNKHAGLCGDPPCSMLKGTINYENISFTTTKLIYDKEYFFKGRIINNKMTGILNKTEVNLKGNLHKLPFNNLASWCSTWKNIPRCNGIKEYCHGESN